VTGPQDMQRGRPVEYLTKGGRWQGGFIERWGHQGATIMTAKGRRLVGYESLRCVSALAELEKAGQVKRVQQVLAFDFDGVLADYSGWMGATHTGEPLPGAKETLRDLSAEYTIIIYTARATAIVEQWLQTYGFPPFEVTNIKPQALHYWDDNAHRFTVWSQIENDLKRQPWWKHKAHSNGVQHANSD
jgi:hypothetical protein